MPVHSFTTPAAQKTHSSQINTRRHIMAADKGAYQGNMEDSIELHMYQIKHGGGEQIVTGSGACVYHEEARSCED